MIVLKLVAGRPLDIKDVTSIMNLNQGHDQKYVLKWLKAFSDVVGRNLVEEYRSIQTKISGREGG
jgi:hypothetical protein